MSSHQAEPSFGRRSLSRAARLALAAGVVSGMRPFGGSTMIDVRNLPSTEKASVPMSSQKKL